MNGIVRYVTFASALFCAATATHATAGTPQWTLSESAGNVQISNPGGTSRKATRGAKLSSGEAVITGPKSRAIIVRGQEFVTIAANSKVSVAAPRQGSKVQIVQTRGNAVYKIQKKTTPHFSTQTPYLAAVVKGTTYSVTVGASGASVQVTEGAVQVQPLLGDAVFTVTPGMIGMVNRDNPSRLSINGTVNQTIESSTAAATAPSADGETVPAFEPVENDGNRDISATNMDAVIKTAIAESGVKIAETSGGLVSGRSTSGVPGASQNDGKAGDRAGPASTIGDNGGSVSIALGNAASPAIGALLRNGAENGGNGNGNGGAGNGNGNGNGNNGGSGGGADNGNGNNGNGNNGNGSGGNGNGNGGSGNGNGGSGGGNGNGGSGNGNGNGGGGNGNGNGGSGNGSGNGNGGSGGGANNGNGNGNGGSGNGNGNGNGNGGAGNGGSGGGNGGSGNGNGGSGNGSGNGNGGSGNGNGGAGSGNGNGNGGSGNGNGNGGSGNGNGNGGSGTGNGGNGNGGSGNGNGNGGSGNGNGNGGSGDGNGGSGNGNGGGG